MRFIRRCTPMGSLSVFEAVDGFSQRCGWRRVDIQGRYIECKDGGEESDEDLLSECFPTHMDRRMLLLVGWFELAIDPPYRRNAL